MSIHEGVMHVLQGLQPFSPPQPHAVIYKYIAGKAMHM